MSKLANIALFALALTTLPAVAADAPRDPRGTDSPRTTANEETLRQQCQKYQGTERDQCMQGKRSGQMGEPPALPDGGTKGRQEVPGTGTTVPK